MTKGQIFQLTINPDGMTDFAKRWPHIITLKS